MTAQSKSRTKGREATKGVIPGRFALSVGLPTLPSPPGWRWTPLADVAQLESGHTPSRQHPEYWDGGIPWVGIRDAVDNHGRVLNSTYQHVSQLGLENSSARLLPAHTVCLSRTASVGFVIVLGTTMATSQDFVNWVCGPAIDPHYLKYVLIAEGESLLRFASGTTHQTIYYPEAKAFSVLLPPPQEQQSILSVLRPLDDKIELNRQMNETLEAMARALFKSWFVDFDPVRAKMAGRTPFGMDAATAALFPAALDSHGWAQQPELPNSWSVSPIRDLVEGVYDGPHATPPDSAAGPIFLGIRNFRPTRLDLTEVKHIAEADWPAWTRRVTPTAGDIVFTYEATLGYFGIVPAGVRCCLGRRTALVRPRASQLNGNYLFHWFIGSPFQAHLQAHKNPGSTVDRILLRDFPDYPVLVPPRALVEAFAALAAPMAARLESCQAESRTLAELRDLLLPKLLSGELRIRDAEKAVEAVI